MKQELLGMFKNRLLQAQVVAGGLMMAMAGSAQAFAAGGGMKQKLETLVCSVAGSSSITLFAGAAAVISFLVMFTLGEGKEGVATILKIVIGISGLLFLPSLMTLVGVTGAGGGEMCAGHTGSF